MGVSEGMLLALIGPVLMMVLPCFVVALASLAAAIHSTFGVLLALGLIFSPLWFLSLIHI